MKDPSWIDEAAEAAVDAYNQASMGFKMRWSDIGEHGQNTAREQVRAVLLVQDKHECRGPADRRSA